MAKKEETVTGQAKRQLFFDSSGIFHVECIPEGATVNKNRYKEILCHLHSSVQCKYPELRQRKIWLLLHDSTSAHCSVLVQEELAKQQVTILPHLPYSPDLTLCDFFSSLLLKEKLYVRQFQSTKEIVTAIFLQISFSIYSSSYTNIGILA
jgi:hypothetical protein